MIWKAKIKLASKIFLVLLFLVQLSVNVYAFPFDKASGVTELSPDTLFRFVSTHKPSVILFYAPWCGHCKSFHAEYKNFAEAAKGTIRVGAIDAHTHSSIAQQFGVRGFPTIKYWKMGNKSAFDSNEYHGPRTAASLMSLMSNDIRSDRVIQSVRAPEDILGLVQKSPKGKIVVLFSSKKKVPPIFSVLSISPRLKDMPFVFVQDEKNTIGARFGIPKIPSVAVVQSPSADHGEATVFPGESFSYEALANFLWSFLEQGEKGEQEGKSPNKKNKEGKGKEESTRDAASNSASGERGLSEVIPPQRLDHLPPQASVTPFNAKTLENYCSVSASKRMGHIPWCVVSLSDALVLEQVYTHFQHEPLLFFSASERLEELRKALSAVSSHARDEIFQTTSSERDSASLLLWRQTKPGTVRYKVFSDIKNDNDLISLLQRLLDGDLHLQKEKVSPS